MRTPAMVLPAYAGMILGFRRGTTRGGRAPRECGDDPGEGLRVHFGDRCSPRMRG